ncbi:MAG: PAS domain S-box protein [Lentimicrobium sp.]|nr:PAS domain S-box protein [Lentimicrobium sp.]
MKSLPILNGAINKKAPESANVLFCIGKKVLVFFIFLFGLHTLTLAQTIKLDSLLTREEIIWLNNNRNNIRYAPNPSWVPGDYTEDGIHKGIVSEYIQIFEQKLGVTFQRVYYQNWAEIIEGLRNSEVDFVGAIQQTPDRDAYLCFTQPFHKSTLGIVVRTNYGHPLTNEHIGTMKLASIEDYSSTAYIRQQFPTAQVIEYKFDFSALMSASYGETDGAVVDFMTASHIVELNGITNLKFAKQLDFSWDLRLASIKQKPQLASILDKLLSTITEEQRKEIVSHWVKFDIVDEPSFYERNKLLVWGVVTFLVVFILLAIVINLYLKNQIRLKTAELVIARDNAIRNEETSRNLFEKHAAVKLIIDPETRNIVDANRAAALFYGWPEEKLKEMNISQINTSAVDVIKKAFRSAQTHQKTCFEFVHRKADGSLVDVEVFSSGVKIGDKEFLHSIIHDISEKKKAEDKLRLLNRAVEASSVSVVITDAVGNIIFVNPYFAELTGYSAQEVIGRKLRILNHGKLSEPDGDELWRLIRLGNDWTGEYQNQKKNGAFYWEQSVISPLLSSTGELTHIISINEDITERKKMLEELVAAKDKAEESNRLKSAFLANMSHEIRTPMNGILGFTELLLEPDLSNENKESFINIVHQSGQRMLSTVNDIVEISKIEAGMVYISEGEINLNERIKELIRFFKPEAETKGLKLIVDKLLPIAQSTIKTDTNKLNSILTNLIKNSIKFTDSGTINLGCQYKGAAVEFYIKDTGIGIPVNRQKAIFERFVQADIEDKMVHQGSGLGLSISKAYIEMLGGKIWVESEEGKGSTFYVHIPCVIVTKEQGVIGTSITDNETKNKIKNLKILVAEDDETSEKLISFGLEKFSKAVLKARTGFDAVEIYRNNPDIDLILMDIQMPVVNGYEATRQIREFNSEVVIIAQTAFAQTGDREKSIAAGCNDYISKPVNNDELLSLIEKYFEK